MFLKCWWSLQHIVVLEFALRCVPDAGSGCHHITTPDRLFCGNDQSHGLPPLLHNYFHCLPPRRVHPHPHHFPPLHCSIFGFVIIDVIILIVAVGVVFIAITSIRIGTFSPVNWFASHSTLRPFPCHQSTALWTAIGAPCILSQFPFGNINPLNKHRRFIGHNNGKLLCPCIHLQIFCAPKGSKSLPLLNPEKYISNLDELLPHHH